MKVEIKNPMGRKKREKLDKISATALTIESNFNFVYEKLEELDLFISRFNVVEYKIQVIFDTFVVEDIEPTAQEIAEQEKQMKEAQEQISQQMEITIQNALINLVNKPENQKAIMDFAEQFSQGMQGKGQFSGMVDADGNPNIMAIIEKLMSNRGMGGQPKLQGQPQQKGKSTGY